MNEATWERYGNFHRQKAGADASDFITGQKKDDHCHAVTIMPGGDGCSFTIVDTQGAKFGFNGTYKVNICLPYIYEAWIDYTVTFQLKGKTISL